MEIFFINLKNLSEYNSDNIKLSKLQHKYSEFFSQKILNDFYKNNSIIVKEKNKPYVKNKSLFLSISHSKEILIIIFDINEVGIDIQYKKKIDYKNILKRFKINNELSEENFFQLWTIYEAEYKSKINKNILSFKYENYICSISSENEIKPNLFEIIIKNNKITYQKINSSQITVLPEISLRINPNF